MLWIPASAGMTERTEIAASLRLAMTISPHPSPLPPRGEGMIDSHSPIRSRTGFMGMTESNRQARRLSYDIGEKEYE